MPQSGSCRMIGRREALAAPRKRHSPDPKILALRKVGQEHHCSRDALYRRGLATLRKYDASKSLTNNIRSAVCGNSSEMLRLQYYETYKDDAQHVPPP